MARLSGASVSPIVEFALRFVRTIILSHLLMPDNLGAVVALVAILASCEVITDVGIDKFIVVVSGERRAQAVAAAQQIIVIRAIVMALAMALLAPELASIFGARSHARNVAWLAVVPLVKSLRSWRIVQIQQEYRYGPEATANIVAQVGAVIAVVPAALWFKDERAMLVSLAVEAAIYVTLSHLLVPQERVHTVDPQMRKAALTFGLPLMANGIGLAILAQADRAIVANLFNLATLATYSLALTIAIIPLSPLQRVAGNISLPFLARAGTLPEASRQSALVTMLGSLVVASVYAIGTGLFLEKLVPLLYGSTYVISSMFCALVAIIAFLRICRGGVNLILLARSDTGRLTIGNIMGGAGLLVGFLLALWSHRVEAVLLGLLIGDLLSLAALLALASRHIPMGRALRHGSVLALTVGATASAPLIIAGSGWGVRALLFAASVLVIGSESSIAYRWVVAPFLKNRHAGWHG